MEQTLALFADMPVEWRVFFLSMLPVTELRAALPLGVAWGLELWRSFVWATVGNAVPVPLLLAFWAWVYRRLSGISLLRKPLARFGEYNRRKGEKVRRYGMLGLLLLVAVPLPGTGVWTGSIVATLLGLRFWPSAAVIISGAVIAGVAVTLITSGVLVLSAASFGQWLIRGALLAAAICICIKLHNK
ncbi:MAG: small multi-drug export protein [Bacillota bacterium]|nr:small multi-drug export protein [Bacillota bacterium]